MVVKSQIKSQFRSQFKSQITSSFNFPKFIKPYNQKIITDDQIVDKLIVNVKPMRLKQYYCTICNRQFYRKAAFNAHQINKKHQPITNLIRHLNVIN